MTEKMGDVGVASVWRKKCAWAVFLDSARLDEAGINVCQGTENTEECEVGLPLCIEARLVACCLCLRGYMDRYHWLLHLHLLILNQSYSAIKQRKRQTLPHVLVCNPDFFSFHFINSVLLHFEGTIFSLNCIFVYWYAQMHSMSFVSHLKKSSIFRTAADLGYLLQCYSALVRKISFMVIVS